MQASVVSEENLIFCCSFLPQKSAEDKHDELDSDFADVNKAIIDVKAKIQEVASEVTSRAETAEKSKGKKDQSGTSSVSPANEKLAELKAELTKLEMEKQQILDKMAES